MESWDDDNFEPQVVSSSVVTTNKWVGEDEEENVKESWEDEEEQKSENTEELKPASAKPKKKSLQEIIAEKERKKREEQEKRFKEQQEDEISPEERLRRQKESDLKIALETTFGGGNDTPKTGLDSFNPTTKEEFQDFTDALSKKIQPLAKSTEYPLFVEDLIRNLCVTLTSHDIKKIKTTIDNLYLEKQKIEKGDKVKKNKGKGKAKIKVEGDNQYSAYVDDYNDDFDDFM